MPPLHPGYAARCGGIVTTVQPLPSVEPALLLADLLEESEANVLPALDSAALDGLPIAITSLLGYLGWHQERRGVVTAGGRLSLHALLR